MTKAVSSRALSVMVALLFGLLIFWAAYFFGYLLFGQVFTARPAYAATTFTVNTTADPGDGVCNATECTLREAITAANATTAADTIKFNIPGSGLHTIRPLGSNCSAGSSGSSGSGGPDPCGPLPEITNPVTIDGYSQPGSKPNTLANGDNAQLMIELDGQYQNTYSDGLVIKAANSTVKGLVINRFPASGVVISGSGATGNKVMSNYIGISAAGDAKLANGNDGVFMGGGAYNNTVGGTKPAARNIISGGTNASGVEIKGSSAFGNKVQGNYIGTNKDGDVDLGNYGDGVLIDGARDNTVGGLMTRRSKPRNIISGNDTSGVHIKGVDATGNKVQDNYVGTDKTGHSDLGNSLDGVFIDGASDNTVGGTTAGARNIISGNNNQGVEIFGGRNQVKGNYIGTDATGTLDRGNSGNGVDVYGASNNIIGGTTVGERNIISGNDTNGVAIYSPGDTQVIKGNYIGTDVTGTLDLGNSGNGVYIVGVPNNTIGGTEAGARNIIFGNDDIGVDILHSNPFFPATGNRILSNSIDRNTGLGIDFVDSDNLHPHGLQDFPTLSSATRSGTKTTIAGTVTSTSPQTTLTIQFFSSPQADPSGFGEGKTFLGEITVTTGTSGGGDNPPNANFSFSVSSSKIPAGGVVTATATDPDGNTSEFSNAVSP